MHSSAFGSSQLPVDPDAHLFGAMFARDNLDWQSRQLATVGALSALPGVEPQLQSHITNSMHVGLTAPHLRQLADVLWPLGDESLSSRT